MNKKKLYQHFQRLFKNVPAVKVNKNGRAINWNQLSDFSKKDTLENGIYDNVDFSKSKDKYPALKLYNSHHHKYPSC